MAPCGAIPHAIAAAEWYVNPGESIQTAIDAADAAGGGTVHVAAGTYYELITLSNGVLVQGAGAAVTTINGDTDSDGYAEGYVVSALGVNSTARLEGFTITNNHGAPDWGEDYVDSGGMHNENSSPTITNCTFFRNDTLVSGAGMHNDNSSPILTNCTFSGNGAEDLSGGGGMYNYRSSPTLTNCVFSGNGGWDGGGMFNYKSSPSLTDCTFSGNEVGSVGGGMCNEYSSPTLTNCTFSGNRAPEGSGGGMYNRDSSPTLTGCAFSGHGSSRGGGIYNRNSSPTLVNCTFSGNKAWVYNGGGGGGMYNTDNSSPTVTNCVFSGNMSRDGSGGGMYNEDSSPRITNCTFSGNSAGDLEGGGMYNTDNSSPTVTDCIFSGNSAEAGGGMWNGGSSPNLTNCAFYGNSANEVAGGGMFNVLSSPTLVNCTFSGNGSSRGGGMYNSGSSPTLANCSFTGNEVDWYDGGWGAGMYNRSSSPTLVNCTFSGNKAWDYNGGGGGGMYNTDNSSPTVTNCILWGNDGGEISNEQGSSPAVTYCDVMGGYPGTGNINMDPLSTADLHLQPGSPCIDRGNNSAVPAGITTDFDGDDRILDGDGDGTATVDMGADEAQAIADTTPPAAVADLAATTATSASVTLTWTSPGDDGNTGTASIYDIRCSAAAMTDANWESADQCNGEPAPKMACSAQTFTVTGLSANTLYYFAIKTADEVPNWSGLSNVVSWATAPPDTSPPAVTTSAASSITTTSATLNGDLTSMGTAANVTVSFECGTTPVGPYNLVAEMGKYGVGAFSTVINGLTPGTTYYYRTKAVGDGDPVYGAEKSFTTGEGPEIYSVDPDSAKRLQSLTVTILGSNFDGATGVSFGSGITVEGVSVVSSSEIAAEITIDADATQGARDVSVTTGWGTTTRTDGFAVVRNGGGICSGGPLAAPGAPSDLTLVALAPLLGAGYLLVRREARNKRDSVRA